jgi:hypothetical protein
MSKIATFSLFGETFVQEITTGVTFLELTFHNQMLVLNLDFRPSPQAQKRSFYGNTRVEITL